MLSPLQPRVAAPYGTSVMRELASPAPAKARTSAGSSVAGALSGSTAMVVMPPALAASAAEAMVSRYS